MEELRLEAITNEAAKTAAKKLEDLVEDYYDDLWSKPKDALDAKYQYSICVHMGITYSDLYHDDQGLREFAVFVGTRQDKIPFMPEGHPIYSNPYQPPQTTRETITRCAIPSITSFTGAVGSGFGAYALGFGWASLIVGFVGVVTGGIGGLVLLIKIDDYYQRQLDNDDDKEYIKAIRKYVDLQVHCRDMG